MRHRHTKRLRQGIKNHKQRNENMIKGAMLLLALVVSGCSSYKDVTLVAPFDPWPHEWLHDKEEPPMATRYFKGRMRDRIWRDK